MKVITIKQLQEYRCPCGGACTKDNFEMFLIIHGNNPSKCVSFLDVLAVYDLSASISLLCTDPVWASEFSLLCVATAIPVLEATFPDTSVRKALKAVDDVLNGCTNTLLVEGLLYADNYRAQYKDYPKEQAVYDAYRSLLRTFQTSYHAGIPRNHVKCFAQAAAWCSSYYHLKDVLGVEVITQLFKEYVLKPSKTEEVQKPTKKDLPDKCTVLHIEQRHWKWSACYNPIGHVIQEYYLTQAYCHFNAHKFYVVPLCGKKRYFKLLPEGRELITNPQAEYKPTDLQLVEITEEEYNATPNVLP